MGRRKREDGVVDGGLEEEVTDGVRTAASGLLRLGVGCVQSWAKPSWNKGHRERQSVYRCNGGSVLLKYYTQHKPFLL